MHALLNRLAPHGARLRRRGWKGRGSPSSQSIRSVSVIGCGRVSSARLGSVVLAAATAGKSIQDSRWGIHRFLSVPRAAHHRKHAQFYWANIARTSEFDYGRDVWTRKNTPTSAYCELCNQIFCLCPTMSTRRFTFKEIPYFTK